MKGKMMRNKHGVMVKPGYWAWYEFAGKDYEGKVLQTMSISGDVHALILRDGGRSGQADAVRLNQVRQVLPPMRRTRGGVVKANPVSREISIEANNAAFEMARMYGFDDAIRRCEAMRDANSPGTISFALHNEVCRALRQFKRDGAMSRRSNPLSRVTIDGPSQRERTTKTGAKTKRPSARLIERRIKTASTSRKGIYANPLVRVKVNSPSMATDEAPDDRLLDRRRRTAKAPAGFYANPVRPSAKRYYVTVKKPRSSRFEPVAEFRLWEFAVVYGRALRNAHPSWTVKVKERKP